MICCSNVDLILANGNIITVDDNFSIRQAVAIKDDKIVAVGMSDEIMPFAGKKTHVIDLQGKTVLPGINDCHTHTAFWGGTRPPLALDLNYPVVKSIRDVVEAVREKAKSAKPGDWIRGTGWNKGFLEECLADQERNPTKWDLDPVSPDNPVCLNDFSVHTLWVNSKALEVAGITKETPNPSGGEIVRDPQTGELTGLFCELSAQALIMQAVPAWTKAEKRAGIENAIREINSLGITSFTEAALGPGGESHQGGLLSSECISIYNDLMDEQKLTARVNILYLFGEYGACSLADFQKMLPALGIHSGFGNKWLKIGGVKIFADGIPPIKTAWMKEPYVDGGTGSLVLPGSSDAQRVAELEKMVAFSHAYGFQVGVHATGDRAVESTIDSFIKAETQDPKGLRHYLIHADFISPEYARLAARHQIAVCAQPALQWTLADDSVNLVGPERAKRQWAFKMLLDAGVILTGSSDVPCTYPNWLQAVQSAVTRTSKSSGRVAAADQCVSREQAIRMHTIAAAWQDRMEARKGSIEPGKLADLCVLDQDILKVDEHDIAGLKNVMTIVGGKIVYRSESM